MDRALREEEHEEYAISSGTAETLTKDQIESLGISIIPIPMEEGVKYFVTKEYTVRGRTNFRFYDTKWIARPNKENIQEQNLFPSEIIARIAISIQLAKGVIL